MTTEKTLRAGLAALQLELLDTQVAQLLAYAGLIQKWNKTYNLTAVDAPEQIVTHHLLDSLSIILLLQKREQEIEVGRRLEAENSQKTQRKLLDVGAGAGLPGVVIAICCPRIHVTCVDAVAKKTAFIQQVALQLKLPNLQSRHARVETITEKFDFITSRAFATLLDFTNWTKTALAAQGLWLAMKGKHPADEISALPAGVQVMEVAPLAVPGLDAQRCLVWMRQVL